MTKQIVMVALAATLNILLYPTALTASDHFQAKQPDYRAAEQLLVERGDIDLAAEFSASVVGEDQAASTVWTGMAEAASPFWTTVQPLVADTNSATGANGTGVDGLDGRNTMLGQDTTLGQNATLGQSATLGVVDKLQPGAPAAGQQKINYRVTVNLGTLKEYQAVSSHPSYSDIYRFKHLIFAHNTANLFGNLADLRVGQVITVAEGETATDFRVVETAVYENTAHGLDGDPEFINKLAAHAMGHDLALLTCAGTPYGNGNATHRLVVYADTL